AVCGPLCVSAGRGVLVRDAANLARPSWPSPTLRDYFELAWLISSLAMIGGALGAALESDDAVREAAYVQHSDDEDEIEKAA
ncbi:MAG: hypothetical protein QOE48_2861, partial [Mycobacterium sp.]|nr:hypothetical protein [Mycobacterium sp.]